MSSGNNNGADVGSATVSKVGNLRIFNFAPDNRQEEELKKKQEVSLLMCLDNSGSMGNLTRECANIFCSGLVGKIPGCQSSGTLILFDTEASILAKNFTNPALVTSMQLPRQGRTNITAGIDAAINHIVDEDREMKRQGKIAEANNLLHCLIFLSDGAHNEGPVVNEAFLSQWRNLINMNKIKLAVIVVGIYSNDTTLGMRLKCGVENCRIPSLDPVYYARDGADMRVVLPKLVEGLSTTLSVGTSIDFSLLDGEQENGVFLENMKKSCTALVDSQTQGSVYCLPVLLVEDNKNNNKNNKDQEEMIPQLFANGIPVPLRVVDFNEKDLSAAIAALLPVLAQDRVAHGTQAVSQRQEILEKHLDIADQLITALEMKAREAAENKNKNKILCSCDSSDESSNNNNINNRKEASIDGNERARLLRMSKQARHRFVEERASLNRLTAKLADDSSQLAAFLNGADRKFAAKALIRSDMVGNISADSVVNSLRGNFLTELKAAVAKDKQLMSERSSQINDNLIPSSMLSLQTALETYEDWINLLSDGDGAASIDASDIYSCLVAFSLLAHPVTFAATNAAQMQPLQTFCNWIDPTLVDSGSIFLARQGAGRFNVKGSMGKNIEQCLALVDPSAPNSSSLILRKSQIAQLNNSANICNSLYMAHPEQQLAQHVHAFVKAVENYAVSTNKSRAYLNLAVKILYSFRRMFAHTNKVMTDKHAALFNRWFVEHSSITTSEEDQCDHPYLLVFMLGVADLVGSSSSSSSSSSSAIFHSGTPREAVAACLESRTPILNLINEWLARRSKMILSGILKNNSNSNHVAVSSTVDVAHAVLKKYFGICKENSPQPLDDVLSQEPSIECVKEQCRHYVDSAELCPDVLSRMFSKYSVDGVGDNKYAVGDKDEKLLSAEDVVKRETRSVYLAFKFARAIQLFFISSSSSSSSSTATDVKNWKDLMNYFELHLEAPDALANFIEKLDIAQDDLMENVININNKNKGNGKQSCAATSAAAVVFGKDHIYQSMISQALLYHESSTRQDVDQHDIADPVTLQEMIVSLRMSIYFDLCKIRRQEYLAIIGNVSYANALSAEATTFGSMLGIHTHGLSRQQFWAFLRATSGDAEKQIVFREKSNHSLKNNADFQRILSRACGRNV